MAFLPLSALGGLVGGDRGDVARPQVQDRWGRSPSHPNYGQPPGPGESVGNPAPDPTQDIYGNALAETALQGQVGALQTPMPGGVDPAAVSALQGQVGALQGSPAGGLGPGAYRPPPSFRGTPRDAIAAMYGAVSGGQYTPTQQDIAQWGEHPDAQYLQKIAPAIQQWWNQNKGQNPMGAQPGGDVYGPSAPYAGGRGGPGGFLPLSTFAGALGQGRTPPWPRLGGGVTPEILAQLQQRAGWWR